MWRFNNRTPVKTKRSWTESETKFLANTCLVEEPDDDANDGSETEEEVLRDLQEAIQSIPANWLKEGNK